MLDNNLYVNLEVNHIELVQLSFLNTTINTYFVLFVKIGRYRASLPNFDKNSNL